jgi:hypothetical protein
MISPNLKEKDCHVTRVRLQFQYILATVPLLSFQIPATFVV